MRSASFRILLAALLAGTLAACGGQGEEALDVTVIGGRQAQLSDPADTALAMPSEVLLTNVAQGLVRFEARGQIDSGLAERWNVSDDGLSYIFRVASGAWPDGRPVNARDVARILNRQLRSASRNPLKDTLGAISEIVAMTDRVIEIRLRTPRPNLLQILAQPQFAVVREGQGTGPFQIDAKQDAPGAISMTRLIRIIDDKDRIEHAHLRNAQAAKAITQFRDGEAELVLGGTYADLPLVPRRERSMRNALHFDPVAGLFGLVPARSGGPLADKELRSLLSRGLNRDALVGAFDVPNLVGRTTVLQAGLEGGANPVPPAWTAVPFEDRYPQAVQEARRAIGDERIRLAVDLPEGRGSEILFARLAADWQPLGIDLVRAGKGVPADLKLVDQVAPSTSPAWFVRSFRCGVAPICSEGADNLMNAGRDTKNAVERAALLAEAGRIIDEEILFIPIAAPVRWSLVGDLPGFAENIFARHPLSGLRDKPIRERQ
jgi:peptide/nickel transport system substrate-binding protein